MYTDIQNQINNIKKSLLDELCQTNAIDNNGKVINAMAFETCIKSKMAELKKMENLLVDENGVAKNRYGTNMWLDTISQFQNMLEYKSLNLNMYMLLKKPDMTENKIQKTPIINQIFRKIFGSKTK